MRCSRDRLSHTFWLAHHFNLMSRSLPGVEEWVQQDDNTPVVDFRIPPLPVLNFTFTFVALGINEDWNQKRVLATAKQQVSDGF